MDWFRPREDIEPAHETRRHMPEQSRPFGYALTDYPLKDYSSGLIAGQTERFFAEHQDGPFALWVSFPDHHEPYEAPRTYAEQIPREEIDLPPWPADEFDDTAAEPNRVLYRMLGMVDDDPEDIRGVLQCYYAMVRFLDDMTGEILRSLEELGLREDTIVVFCSDHGDFAGEHGMTCKGGVFDRRGRARTLTLEVGVKPAETLHMLTTVDVPFNRFSAHLSCRPHVKHPLLTPTASVQSAHTPGLSAHNLRAVTLFNRARCVSFENRRFSR